MHSAKTDEGKVIDMTYHELVKKVQTALAKADASKVEGHVAVQVNVTGEAQGAFYMEIADGVLYVAPYDYNDRDALLTADGADVLAVAQGKVSLEDAVNEGKISHEGDWEKTLVLGGTIPMKKTAAKKETKKTAAEAAPAAPKKRGRKPAAKKAEETAAAEAAPKKRGRKPAAKKVEETAKKTEETAKKVEETVVAEAAPVETAPVEAAPAEVAAPVETAPAEAAAPVEAAPAAPKKRGRKPAAKKAEETAAAEAAPKKRGRKPAAKKAEETAAPKKRGRKSTKK